MMFGRVEDDEAATDGLTVNLLCNFVGVEGNYLVWTVTPNAASPDGVALF